MIHLSVPKDVQIVRACRRSWRSKTGEQVLDEQNEADFQFIINSLPVEFEPLIGVEGQGYHYVGQYEVEQESEEYLRRRWLLFASSEVGDIAE